MQRKDLEQKIRRQQKKEEKFLDFAFSISDEDFGIWVLSHMDDLIIGKHTLQAILAEVYRKELFNNNLKALKLTRPNHEQNKKTQMPQATTKEKSLSDKGTIAS